MRLLLAPSVLVLLGCAGLFTGEGMFDVDGDGHGSAHDCNDFKANIHPGAGERCDGKIDEDCDGKIDDEDNDVVNPSSFFEDADGDGFGDPDAETREACVPPAGYVANDDDCNDRDDSIHFGATEVCDVGRTDEDCDGEADDDDSAPTGTVVGYLDADNDGYGDPSDSEAWCHLPSDRVEDGTDCDDSNRNVNPGEDEVCDSRDVDEDCDGGANDDDPDGIDSGTTWYTDADGDGYGNPGTSRLACEAGPYEVSAPRDCDDSNPRISPGAVEICADGIDQDCDGSAAACVGSGEVDDQDANSRILPVETGVHFGYALAAGGDTDGDGRKEVWATTPTADGVGTGTGTGGAFRIEGRLEGQDDASAHGLLVVRSSAVFQLGFAVASGADLDGDGLDDVVFGAPSNDRGYTDAGGVYVLGGGMANGTSETSAIVVRRGSAASEFFGSSVAVGDWNGDGVGDLFSLAFGRDMVYGELGPLPSTDGIGRTLADVSLAAADGFGVIMGDVDGDGLDELAVANSALSKVSVYLGGVLGAGGELLTSIDAPDAYALGAGLIIGADLDGDGLGDLVMGAPYGDSLRGLVYVMHGPLAAGTRDTDDADVQIGHEVVGEYFGYAVAVDGDMNDNGDVELAVGAPGSADYDGSVYVFDGVPGSGIHEITTADLVVRGTQDGAEFGYSLSMTDLDADGSSDLVIGAWALGDGEATVFYGSLR